MNRAQCLEKATEIVLLDRVADHGGPEDSFDTIARMWSAYTDTNISSYDVTAMLVLLKVSRVKNNHLHEDNWVDMAGYAACGCEISTGAFPPPVVKTEQEK